MHANNYNYNTITISYHITKNTSKRIEKTYQQDTGAHKSTTRLYKASNTTILQTHILSVSRAEKMRNHWTA